MGIYNVVWYKASYVYNCQFFKIVCENFPKYLKYVETTILGLVKEKVVRYWIDRIMNIGNTTTNTDESSHSQLEKKKHMGNNMGDICENWASNWRNNHFKFYNLKHSKRDKTCQNIG